MDGSPQLLAYNALEIYSYNPTNMCESYLWNSTYWCCYGNGSVNMCTHDLPDMYALRLQAYVSGKFLRAMLQLLHVIHDI